MLAIKRHIKLTTMKCYKCNCTMSKAEVSRHIEDDETLDRNSAPECDDCAGIFDNQDNSMEYEQYSDADSGL